MGSLAAALWLVLKTQCGPTIDPQLLGSMVYFYVEQFWYENIITKNNQISNYYLAIDVQLFMQDHPQKGIVHISTGHYPIQSTGYYPEPHFILFIFTNATYDSQVLQCNCKYCNVWLPSAKCLQTKRPHVGQLGNKNLGTAPPVRDYLAAQISFSYSQYLGVYLAPIHDISSTLMRQ